MRKIPFKINLAYEPLGDQPQAIEGICQAFTHDKHHVLMGVTGSGKTFTMANVIAKMGIPTLVMAPNKTLAAQLFTEFKELFPENAVEFFISYYDYYQPEAYVPTTDTYIAKDSSINDDIDKMRHAATRSLFERKDVIIVASVSCIYGLGSPQSYANLVFTLNKGATMERSKLLRALVDIQYQRNDKTLERGHFRVRGDTIDILASHQKNEAVRVELFGDRIENIFIIDALTGEVLREVAEISLYPNSHYVTDRNDWRQIINEILRDLGARLRQLKALGKQIEYQRLEQRVMHDVELLEQLGWCSGIENYSRYLTGTAPGEPPPTLLDYFSKEFLIIIDESHMTVPQLKGMYRGDIARKQTLVDFGFRLPAAIDNRPLNFDEFLARSHKILYVSATPSEHELKLADYKISEQVIRPTGLVDPEIIVKPAKNQVDDLYGEIKDAIAKGGRVLITTLTKKMAEDLASFYASMNLKVRYLHSDIESLERVEILRDLRRGDIDVLIGINLLREGLDLPEVRLVAVMDADKEGFLRSRSALIQTTGRAARNAEGRVIFYADHMTDSMRACIEETDRRRAIQIAYNKEHNISPQTIVKSMPRSLREMYGLQSPEEIQASEDKSLEQALLEKYELKSVGHIERLIRQKVKAMQKAAGELEFEKASEIRDEVAGLKELLLKFQNSDEAAIISEP